MFKATCRTKEYKEQQHVIPPLKNSQPMVYTDPQIAVITARTLKQ